MLVLALLIVAGCGYPSLPLLLLAPVGCNRALAFNFLAFAFVLAYGECVLIFAQFVCLFGLLVLFAVAAAATAVPATTTH